MIWGRALAGCIAGFFLSAGLVGLASWLWPGPWQSTIVGASLAFFPVWMIVVAAAFFFRDGRSAWRWLGGMALLSLAMLWTLQSLQWVR